MYGLERTDIPFWMQFVGVFIALALPLSAFFFHFCRLDEETREETYEKAEILVKSRNYPAAIAYLDKAIEKYGDEYPQFYKLRARAKIFSSDSEGAISDLKIAIERGPYDAEPLIEYGRIMMEREAHDEAIDAYNRAISIKCDSEAAFNGRGLQRESLILRSRISKSR